MDDAAPAQRIALVVLGMHRSGTSAMARVLSLVGAALPRDVIPANSTNPTGHWEPMDVAVLNDQLLAAAGTNWASLFGPMHSKDSRQAFRRRRMDARRILRRQYGQAGLIVMKEPRTTLLVDFWADVFEKEGFDCRYVVMVRHPDEVAASLQRRDGLDRASALLIWATYQAQAALNTASARRVFVCYQDLLTDPSGVLHRIERELGVRLPNRTTNAGAAVADFIDPALRHNRASSQLIDDVPPPIAALVDYSFAAASDRLEPEDVPSSVMQWLKTIEAIYLPLSHAQSASFAAERLSLETRIAALHDEVGQLRGNVAAPCSSVVTQNLSENIAALAETLRGRVGRMQDEVAVAAELVEERERRHQAERAVSEGNGAQVELQNQLSATRLTVAALMEEAALVRARERALADALRDAKAKANSLRASARLAEEKVFRADRRVEVLEAMIAGLREKLVLRHEESAVLLEQIAVGTRLRDRQETEIALLRRRLAAEIGWNGVGQVRG